MRAATEPAPLSMMHRAVAAAGSGQRHSLPADLVTQAGLPPGGSVALHDVQARLSQQGVSGAQTRALQELQDCFTAAGQTALPVLGAAERAALLARLEQQPTLATEILRNASTVAGFKSVMFAETALASDFVRTRYGAASLVQAWQALDADAPARSFISGCVLKVLCDRTAKPSEIAALGEGLRAGSFHVYDFSTALADLAHGAPDAPRYEHPPADTKGYWSGQEVRLGNLVHLEPLVADLEKRLNDDSAPRRDATLQAIAAIGGDAALRVLCEHSHAIDGTRDDPATFGTLLFAAVDAFEKSGNSEHIRLLESVIDAMVADMRDPGMATSAIERNLPIAIRALAHLAMKGGDCAEEARQLLDRIALGKSVVRIDAWNLSPGRSTGDEVSYSSAVGGFEIRGRILFTAGNDLLLAQAYAAAGERDKALALAKHALPIGDRVLASNVGYEIKDALGFLRREFGTGVLTADDLGQIERHFADYWWQGDDSRGDYRGSVNAELVAWKVPAAGAAESFRLRQR